MNFVVDFILPMLFRKLLSEPFDKMYMTQGQGQWPRVPGKNGSRKVAFLLKKSVYIKWAYKIWYDGHLSVKSRE